MTFYHQAAKIFFIILLTVIAACAQEQSDNDVGQFGGGSSSDDPGTTSVTGNRGEPLTDNLDVDTTNGPIDPSQEEHNGEDGVGFVPPGQDLTLSPPPGCELECAVECDEGDEDCLEEQIDCISEECSERVYLAEKNSFASVIVPAGMVPYHFVINSCHHYMDVINIGGSLSAVALNSPYQYLYPSGHSLIEDGTWAGARAKKPKTFTGQQANFPMSRNPNCRPELYQKATVRAGDKVYDWLHPEYRQFPLITRNPPPGLIDLETVDASQPPIAIITKVDSKTETGSALIYWTNYFPFIPLETGIDMGTSSNGMDVQTSFQVLAIGSKIKSKNGSTFSSSRHRGHFPREIEIEFDLYVKEQAPGSVPVAKH